MGYVTEKGARIIRFRFAFGFPFDDGWTKVQKIGGEKVVPVSEDSRRDGREKHALPRPVQGLV